jgi:DnaJ-class molecular chaperone
MQSHYETLGLQKNASKDEIKTAYHKLAKVYHPDKNTGNDAKEKFQKIQEAYETLSDDEKRAQYDNPQPQFNIPPEFHQNFQQGFPFNVFNMQPPQPQVTKKGTEYYIFKIKLSDVYFGITKNFNIKKKIMCENCRMNCNNCNGSGVIQGQRIQMGPFVQFINQGCPTCIGNCVIRNNNINCSVCSSSGFKIKEKHIELKIPKGVEDGKEYVFEEWGEQAIKPNEKSGDFIIKIEIQKHDLFHRDNLNLIYTTQISLFESIVGKEIKISYFDEIIELNTNRFGIIDPKKEFIIAEKGLKNDKNERGNLKIKFEIIYPNRILVPEEIIAITDIFKKYDLK